MVRNAKGDETEAGRTPVKALEASLAPWLDAPRRQLAAARREGRLPHAILIHGVAGSGQAALAVWAAQMALCEDAGRAPCGSCGGCTLFLAGNHPDLRVIEIEEKATYIKVDQIRELCAALTLRSFRGGGKVGIIDPADRMNINANNALLKTLEEPSEGALLLLCASRSDQLPRTIVSRCLRIRIVTPSMQAAVAWLDGQERRDDWPTLLALAAGAPFKALELAGAGVGDLAREMLATLAGVPVAAIDPLGLAEAWSRDRPAERLAWLEQWLEDGIRARAPGSDAVNNKRDFRLPSPGSSLNIRAAFALLDRIREARALLEGSLNTQLLIEDLLVGLAEGLAGRTAGRTEAQG